MTDLNQADLVSQLRVLKIEFQQKSKDVTLQSIISHLKGMSAGERALLQEVVTLIKLILVMPATNATSERSFSALRRVKTYLRATMTQQRLNHLMLMHVHKERLDAIDLKIIANEFCATREYRLRIFGIFK